MTGLAEKKGGFFRMTAASWPLLKYAAVSLCAILLPAVMAGAAVPEKPVSVLSPPDRSVMEGSLVSLTLRIKPDFLDEVRISVNGRKVPVPKRQFQQYVACFDGIALSFGLNKVKVVALKEGEKVEELDLQLFYRSDISTYAALAPTGFSRYRFHAGAQEKGCTPCHKLDFRGVGADVASPEESPCYQCHKKLLSSRGMVHGPAAVWSCISCHDKDTLAVQKPENEVCKECHQTSWGSMAFEHGPVAAGSCATCHDPHSSDHPSFLRVSGGEICIGCHEHVLLKPHVLGAFGENGHPVRKSPDPYNPSKEFSCISCHNPHAGTSWTFLNRYDGTSDLSTFCRSCHLM